MAVLRAMASRSDAGLHRIFILLALDVPVDQAEMARLRRGIF